MQIGRQSVDLSFRALICAPATGLAIGDINVVMEATDSMQVTASFPE